MYETNIDYSKPTSSGSVVESSTDGPATHVELAASLGDVGALRGLTDTAADLAPCTCPDECERDHANE